MSDIKNPTPFYTLKEAAKELNRLLNADYYSSKKLLAIASVYDLKLHAYFYGDMEVMVDAHTGADFSDGSHKAITGDIEGILTRAVQFDGAFLEMHSRAIKDLYAKGQSSTNESQLGCLFNPKAELTNSNHLTTTADGCYDSAQIAPIESFNDYANQVKKLQEKAELNVKQATVLATYPIIRTIDEDSILRPKTYSTYEDDDGEFIYHPIIKKEDVYITHTQLMRVISSELPVRMDDYEPNKHEAAERIERKRPQGISIAKQNAKVAAKTLASYLWRKDTAKKIKITEMAFNVYTELCDTEHLSELPSEKVSLKEWIKDIAPKYAREAGRPKEI